MAKDEPKLLSGDNPQIPKGEGDGPVQAYIAAVPGWKQDICRRIDAIGTQQVPGVRKAVKWNSPLYGAPDGLPETPDPGGRRAKEQGGGREGRQRDHPAESRNGQHPCTYITVRGVKL